MNVISVEKMYKQKFSCFDNLPPCWVKALGTPEDNGIWLVWGREKNGKTRLCLALASTLSYFKKVLYVSAEEGVSKTFTDSCRDMNIEPSKNLGFMEYISLVDLQKKLKVQRSADVIFIDNLTIYNKEVLVLSKELKKDFLLSMAREFPKKLFVFVAHEERKEPFTAAAKSAARFANLIIYADMTTGVIGGRLSGRRIIINEMTSKVCFGDSVIEEGEL